MKNCQSQNSLLLERHHRQGQCQLRRCRVRTKTKDQYVCICCRGTYQYSPSGARCAGLDLHTCQVCRFAGLFTRSRLVEFEDDWETVSPSAGMGTRLLRQELHNHTQGLPPGLTAMPPSHTGQPFTPTSPTPCQPPHLRPPHFMLSHPTPSHPTSRSLGPSPSFPPTPFHTAFSQFNLPSPAHLDLGSLSQSTFSVLLHRNPSPASRTISDATRTTDLVYMQSRQNSGHCLLAH